MASPESMLLGKLPPLLDGYEAIGQAIALGDVDHAFWLASQYHRSAKELKRQACAVGRAMDRRDRRNRLEPLQPIGKG